MIKRMKKDSDKMDNVAQKILNHALEIIYLLTGEEYTVVRKNSPHSIIHPLTGEVPIKCDDVAVYFSMEEWEYIEGHKDLYSMMGHKQTLRDAGATHMSDSALINDEGEEEKSTDNQEVEIHLQICAGDHKDLTVLSKEQVKRPCDQEICASNGKDGPMSGKVTDEFHTAATTLEMIVEEDNSLTMRIQGEDAERITYGEERLASTPDCSIPSTNELKEFLNDDDFPVRTGKKYHSDNTRQFILKSDILVSPELHTDTKIYVCPDCKKCFTYRSQLTAHYRTHTGEKPYICSDCKKGFTNSSHLTAHYRIHTGEKPFLCKECGKSFSERSSLVKHSRSHTGEKPYVCRTCGKAFSRGASLYNHYKVHTGEKL